MRTRRYQLSKHALGVLERGHPWIFREQLSSAANVFSDGDWLRLVDGSNKVVGYGMYDVEGAIAIRIVRRGPDRPGAAWVRAQLVAAVTQRQPLVAHTDGIRLLNGESDGIPAVVIDRFGDHLVVSSYAAGSDALARYIGRVLAAAAEQPTRATTEGSGAAIEVERVTADGEGAAADGRRAATTGERSTDDAVTPATIIGPARSITLRPARRRHGTPQPARPLRGSPPEIARFVEDGIEYAVDLSLGHKTGAYLDLRGLRRELAASDQLRGARVLNLFSYTGMLARALETAGAEHVTSVDASERALAFAAEYHAVDRERHAFVTADVFDWLPALSAEEQFDLVIVDPPSMTSAKAKVPAALAAYRKLYRAAADHVRPGGAIVAACCTSRIGRAEFHHAVSEALGHRFKKARELRPEIDHPVGFPQADYLKIAWWRRIGD